MRYFYLLSNLKYKEMYGCDRYKKSYFHSVYKKKIHLRNKSINCSTKPRLICDQFSLKETSFYQDKWDFRQQSKENKTFFHKARFDPEKFCDLHKTRATSPARYYLRFSSHELFLRTSKITKIFVFIPSEYWHKIQEIIRLVLDPINMSRVRYISLRAQLFETMNR